MISRDTLTKALCIVLCIVMVCTGYFANEDTKSEREATEFKGHARGMEEAMGIVALQPPVGDYRIVKNFTVNLTTSCTASSGFAIFMNNSKVYEKPPYEASTNSEVNVTVAAVSDGGVEYLYAWIN